LPKSTKDYYCTRLAFSRQLTIKKWNIITKVSEELHVAFFSRRRVDMRTTCSFQLSIHCYKISWRHILDYNFLLKKYHKQDTLFSFSYSLLVHLTCFNYKSARTHPFFPLTVNLKTRLDLVHFMECKLVELKKTTVKGMKLF
jgi:hypothetical protein